MYGKISPQRRNVKINVYDSMNSKERSIYENIITRDPNVIAQILIDLLVLGFPMEKAVKKFNERMEGDTKDWMGI